MGRVTTLTKLQTDDPELNRLQEHIRAVVNPILAQTQFAASDFRWTQLPKTDQTVAGTWALQFRTTGTTWTTIATFTSAGQIVQPAWIAPTFTNSWVNFGGASLTAGYMKDAQGFVHLRGTISTGTIGLPAFTLPSGYRPSKSVNFATASNSAFGYGDITAAGVVTPDVGSNAWFSLDGITFDTRS